jgi:hypothetical protein
MEWTHADSLAVVKIALAVVLGLVGYSVLAWLKKQLQKIIRWILS